MLLSCPNCGTVTQVADVLIPSARLTATCSGCGARIGGTVPSRLDSVSSGSKQKRAAAGAGGGRRARQGAEDAAAKGDRAGRSPAPQSAGGEGERGSGDGGGSGVGEAGGGVDGREKGDSGDGGRSREAKPSGQDSKAGEPGAGDGGRGATGFRPGLGAASRGLDPERLARLVASDMLLYNREKIQKAAAEGRLLSSMATEIVEAWEFYKKRVGPQTALGTSYFRDALNVVLAGGDRVI
jgi:transcription elongation factor Elf1